MRTHPHVLASVLALALSGGGLPAGMAGSSERPSDERGAQSSTRMPAQVPGAYRFDVGAVRISALSDGTVPLDLHALLVGIDAGEMDAILREDVAASPVETSINAYVVDLGDHLVLVDTGSGDLFGPVGGKLPASLAAAGYRPEQITDILLTHIHTDHSGGLTRGGRMFFPNATVHVAGEDLHHFTGEAVPGREDMNRLVEEAASTVGVYRQAGKVKVFTGRTEILPGITAMPTPGHTPGHTFYRLASGEDSIEFWGDILHAGQVQLKRPSVTITFDVDQNAAREQRARQLSRAAKDSTFVALAHLPFPGIGYIRQEDGAYGWVPAAYRDRD